MNEPLIIEKTYNAPIEKVWSALTDLSQLRQWYFNLPDFKAQPGFEFSFEAGSDTKSYLHLCKVVEVIPGRKLSYTWRYDGYPGDSLVSFELFAEDEHHTKLILTHDGLETLAVNGPDFSRTSFSGGWTHFAHKALKDFVEDRE